MGVQEQSDVTMQVLHIRMTSKINCDDATILSQKRLSLATMAKLVISNFFEELCIQDIK